MTKLKLTVIFCEKMLKENDKRENLTEEIDDLNFIRQIKLLLTNESNQSFTSSHLTSYTSEDLFKLINELKLKYLSNLSLTDNLCQEKLNLVHELNSLKKKLKQLEKCHQLHKVLLNKDENKYYLKPPRYDSVNDQNSMRFNIDLSTSVNQLNFYSSKEFVRPRSADSFFRKKNRITSTAQESTLKTLVLNDIKYETEQIEYLFEKERSELEYQKLLRLLRKSYENNPCLDWKTEEKLRQENRLRQKNRQKEHFNKWKQLNEQIKDFHQSEKNLIHPPDVKTVSLFLLLFSFELTYLIFSR